MTAVFSTETEFARFPLCLANALERRAAARARSASAKLCAPVALTLAANESVYLLTSRCSGVGTAETAETATRRKDRSADVGNIFIDSVQLKVAKGGTREGLGGGSFVRPDSTSEDHRRQPLHFIDSVLSRFIHVVPTIGHNSPEWHD